MTKRVIYPGTFDPITNGHMDIVKRAGRLFDEVIVAVAASDEKGPMFGLEARVAMAEAACAEMPEVRVESFSGLLVDFCREMDSTVIVRGLRAVSDFEYELQMGYANQSLDNEIETLYLMPSLQNAFISSSVVRAILRFKGDVSHLVPSSIIPLLESQ